MHFFAGYDASILYSSNIIKTRDGAYEVFKQRTEQD